MKSQPEILHPAGRRSQSGVALVIILFVMLLVVGVVVAFLSSVQSERGTATTFLSTSQVQRMSDSVVGIAETQISNAAGKTNAAGQTEAWVSQPGMVRTYNTNGLFDTAYKLYSATTLSTTDPTQITADMPPTTWANSPVIWSDVNAPVTDNGNTTYPVLDPSGLNVIQGFSINSATTPGATAAQPVPMPVHWLYVLKDGSIIAPDTTSSGNVATFTGNTKTITGRIAFWTDDETCKVNINTAGVGDASTGTTTFWDTPHYVSTNDYKLATSQPLDGEFQRYPGHPSITSLNAVFPTATYPALTAENILTNMAPKYQSGGSVEGTVDTYAMTSGITFVDKPLRASVAELIFPANTRSPYPSPMNTTITRPLLEGAKFFLTSSNTSPELNLLNLPRVACWPITITSGAASQTAEDKVIAFCSTINQKPYYFQRTSALSSTTDANISRNLTLYTYLQNLSKQALPGFGVSLDKKFTTGSTSDTNQILTEIWDYIRCTDLYDSRLLTANLQFTGALANSTGISNIPGLGYVVPLQVTDPTTSTTTQGFGRAMSLSELAFHFICTADSVSSPQIATGLLGSNDTTQNHTLGGTALVTTDGSGNTINQRRIQMLLLPEFFSASLGNITMQVPTKSYRFTLSGLDTIKLGGASLFSSSSAQYVLPSSTFNVGVSNGRRYGGTFHYCAILSDTYAPATTGFTDNNGGSAVYTQYPFISNFVTVSPGTTGVMAFTSGSITFTIETSSNSGSTWVVSQTGTITPPASANIPVPNLVTDSGSTAAANAHWWAFSNQNPWYSLSIPTGSPPVGSGQPGGRLDRIGSLGGGATDEPDSTQYAGAAPNYVPVDNGTSQVSTTMPSQNSLIRAAETGSAYYDVVRSMQPSHGDYRLVAGVKNVPSQAFTALGDWTAAAPANALMHTLEEGHGALNYTAGAALFRRHFVTTNPIGGTLGNSGLFAPDFRNDNAAAATAVQTSGDFDNPMSIVADGAYINKPDEGTILSGGVTLPPYFNNGSGYIDASTFFSPNRIMPGPGMFGSLPTHLQRYLADPTNPQLYAWRTLLFRRQPTHPDAVAINSTGLPTGLAPDHLLMDFFWMPTVEPYAISQPFSSAGKINMNYEILPFTYIVRKTGMYAVLDNEKIPAVPNTAAVAKTYKSQTSGYLSTYRQTIDIAQTLSQFDTRFTNADTGGSATGRIFVSPTELCDLWLVPTGQAPDDTTMNTFWSNNALTGDNMRERPYTTIIPRLTTKSNTYTIHYRVQVLKSPGTDPTIWDESKGTVLAESRGSTTIERFLDPTDATIPDYASNPGATPALSTFYHWRVLANHVFAP